MDNLTFRPATPDDSAFAYDVKRAAFRTYIQQVWPWDEEEQRRLHDERFRTQGFRVVSVDGADVGIMTVDVEADCVRVNQLFILPEHQGKGVGRECMVRVIEEARELGLPVQLRVMKVNPRARAFYERLGFVQIGETDTHDLMEWTGSSK